MQEAAQASEDSENHSFKRSLSAFNLVMLGIGGVIGAGIFILTGQAAATNAGPAVTLSFLLGAVACAFAGLCYAEMASSVPISGSARIPSHNLTTGVESSNISSCCRRIVSSRDLR